MLILWFKKRRDDQTVKKTIMPRFTPPKNLSPTELGAIIDEKINPRDITAAIIDFAVKGYIKITEIEKKWARNDYELELLEPYKTNKKFEKIIFEKIFKENKKGEKTLSSTLEDSFYVKIPELKKEIMNSLTENKYFYKNPDTIRKIYLAIGLTLIFAPITLIGLIEVLGIIIYLSFVITGLIVLLFGRIMPRKTKKGTEIYYHLRGLFEYMLTAEKDRMKFQEDKLILFEKLLPYAVSFGITKKWAKKFKGILKNPPNWFKAVKTENIFNINNFAKGLNSLNKKINQSITSRPNSSGTYSSGSSWSGGSGFSSGGSFSGGGFGGGGGRGL